MTDETKNMWDFILSIVAMLGAGVAFWVGIHQWRRGQRWQRSEQMDQFVRQFEADELLRLSATVIDWTRRTIPFREKEFTVTNTDSLMALRIHTDMGKRPVFEGEQATLRDAYDALLAFFTRLELALTTGLIDAAPARQYFGYWLQQFLSFDKHHPDNRTVEEVIASLKQRQSEGKEADPQELRQRAERIHNFMRTANPPQLVEKYIEAYGDPKSIERLKMHLDPMNAGRRSLLDRIFNS